MRNIKWRALLPLVLAVFVLCCGCGVSDMSLPWPAPQASVNLAEGEGLTVYFFDVGQADCALVRADGHDMLIDAGDRGDDGRVLGLLRDRGVTRLDYIVATHPHADHIGCMASVVREFDFDSILMPDAETGTKTFEELLDAIDEKGAAVDVPSPGDTFSLGGARVEVLAPAKGYDNLNDMSIVLRLTYGDTSFLLTGDAEKASERDMLASGLPLSADVLKVGHHGSNTSSREKFLKAVSPKYAVISCGKDNSYGHPDRDTLKRLEDAGAKVFRTDENGTVTAFSDGINVKITAESDGGQAG